MKVLVTGASGQLGSDVVSILTKENVKVTSYSSEQFDFSSNVSFEPNEEFDIFINCMAMTNTSLCEEKKEMAFKLNAERVKEIALLCKRKNKLLIHISTDYVFSGKNNFELTEDHETTPLNVYGESKLKGEQYIKEILDTYFIFRVSSLYGVNSKHGNFIETMISKSKQKDEISVVSDQFMSPTHSLDVAKMIYHIISSQNDKYGIYHFSGDGSCSWYEFTKEIFKICHIDKNVNEVSFKDFPSKLTRPQYSKLSNLKINSFYETRPWQESLKEYLRLKGHI